MAKKEMVAGVAVYANRSCWLSFPDGSKTDVQLDVDGKMWIACGAPDRGGPNGEVLESDESEAVSWTRRIFGNRGEKVTVQDKEILSFCEKRLRDEWGNTGA